MAGLAVRTLLRSTPCLFSRMVGFQVTRHERQWIRTLVIESKNMVDLNCRRLASSMSSNLCWKCGANNEESALLCAQCRVLQKPERNVNYFKLFGFEPGFDLDQSSLTKTFRKMQSILHPDKYGNSSQEERTISEEYSSIVNKAYSTLQQPLKRGLYMLELEGIHVEEKNVQSDPTFLMDLMERNEEVDDANNDTKIKAVIEKNKRVLDKLKRETSDAFKTGDLQAAKKALIKMKYFTSIEAKIKVLKANKGYID